jgi:hypothetical protein
MHAPVLLRNEFAGVKVELCKRQEKEEEVKRRLLLIMEA